MYDSSYGTLAAPKTDSQPTTIYAFGKVQTVPKYQVYQMIDSYIQQGYDPAKVLEEFSNNVVAGAGGYGSSISYQELQGVVNNAVNNYGKYTGTATGASAPIDQTTVDLGSKIDALNNLYNLIYGDLNAQTQEKRGQLEKQYGEQRTGLQSQYEKSQAVLPNAFVARGTRYSSDYENAARDAADTYNTNLSAIQQNQDQSLASLGSQYQKALSGYQSAQSALGQTPRSFTGTAAEAQQAQMTLDNQLNSLSAARSGLMTDAGYRGALNNIAPAQNMGASALQEQLAKITNSSIPGYAKDTIAQGLIKQSGQDSNFYTDYYEKLKGGLSTPLQ